MSEEIKIYFDEDGIAKEYDDTYDITIHCESKKDHDELLDRLDRLNRQWIPVGERLPEKPNNYPYCEIHRTYFLVSLASGCVKALGYEFDRNEWQITGSPVVAWMPLPEPYKASPTGEEVDE